VIALLRTALRAGQLRRELTADQMEDLLTHLEKCWWSIKIESFEDKWHFLQYVGRYVRRPPIAQRRITWIGERTVKFWYKDKKLRRRVEVQRSLEEFIDHWAQHILERYQHAVRGFGLFAQGDAGAHGIPGLEFPANCWPALLHHPTPKPATMKAFPPILRLTISISGVCLAAVVRAKYSGRYAFVPLP
jgi:hypothetical protein